MPVSTSSSSWQPSWERSKWPACSRIAGFPRRRSSLPSWPPLSPSARGWRSAAIFPRRGWACGCRRRWESCWCGRSSFEREGSSRQSWHSHPRPSSRSSTRASSWPGSSVSPGCRIPSLSILLFLCLVFGNDMAAYFAGSLWGASTRLNLSVSPHKSIVGFAAGFAGSLIVVGLFILAVPDFPRFGIAARLVLGLADRCYRDPRGSPGKRDEALRGREGLRRRHPRSRRRCWTRLIP